MDIKQKLKNVCVGVAGCGGLGSNVAMHLARADVGKLVICDYDKVEKENLNRQFYFLNQIGQLKAKALNDNLKKVTTETEVVSVAEKIDENNIGEIFEGVDILAECFDKAEAKKMLIESASRTLDVPVVSGNGMAGYGNSNDIKTRRVNDKLIVVGDGETGIDKVELLTSARVGIVAAHQANAIIEMILEQGTGK